MINISSKERIYQASSQSQFSNLHLKWEVNAICLKTLALERYLVPITCIFGRDPKEQEIFTED